ncbi:MAG: Cys-tRNA(Pro) deacylase, partial [Clostridia bacterium]|nr:Cys-tRNA(Pro) deacylase [Clostridia bacterium]
MAEEKTNVMRTLEQKKVPYTAHCYVETGETNGVKVAALLGEPPEHVFKTLVTVGKTGRNYVFIVPVAEELDLKKAAKAVGEKSIAMIKAKEL